MQVLGAVDGHQHICQLVLDYLEGANGPVKLHPLLGIITGHIQHRLACPEDFAALQCSCPFQDKFHNVPAPIFLAQYAVLAHFNLVKLTRPQ